MSESSSNPKDSSSADEFNDLVGMTGEDKASPGFLRRLIGPVLKISLAAGLFYILWSYGKFKPGELWKSRTQWEWPWMLLSFFFLFLPLIITAVRWRILLQILGFQPTFRQTFRWNMIGALFDQFMVGATGGDVVKSMYVFRAVGKGSRSLAVMSVLLDRMFGLVGLFFLACIFAVVGELSSVGLDPRIKYVLWLLPTICFGWVVLFLFLTSQKLRNSRRRKKLFAWLPGAPRWERIFEGCIKMRDHMGRMIIILGLCLLNHTLICLGIIFLSYGMQTPLEFGSGLVLIPLCLFINSFGVFGGLGAGEAAFEGLLSDFISGGGKEGVSGLGTNLALMFHAIVAVTKLFGLPFYIANKKESLEAPELDNAEGEKPVAEIEPQAVEKG